MNQDGRGAPWQLPSRQPALFASPPRCPSESAAVPIASSVVPAPAECRRDLGFRVWCFGFRVWCFGFRVEGLDFQKS